MQLLDLQQLREEQELQQMQEDLGRSNNNNNNAGHQSELSPSILSATLIAAPTIPSNLASSLSLPTLSRYSPSSTLTLFPTLYLKKLLVPSIPNARAATFAARYDYDEKKKKKKKRVVEQLSTEWDDRAEWGQLHFTGPAEANHQAGTSGRLRTAFAEDRIGDGVSGYEE
ncbi:hypothetical protein NHQ30_011322 [Ciborinia camelliae]|nr:hypothetical protein NHQ30_011322 [Ciborinia camelliae]